MLPEGTFVARRAGTFRVSAAGVAVFAPDAVEGDALRPMVVMPSMQLERLESALAARTVRAATGEGLPAARVMASGQVFTYQRRAYLLLTAFSLADVGAAAAPEAQASTPPATPGAGTPAPTAPGAEVPPGAGDDPGVEDLMRALETQRTIPRTIDPATPTRAGGAGGVGGDGGAGSEGGSVPAQAEPGAPAAPEGRALVARRGRVVRDPGGGFLFTPDSGLQGARGAGDSPLPLLPNQVLERAHEAGVGGDDGRAVEVSGRTLVYRGTTYLLPTLVQVTPASDVRPMQ
jgi:hypothetical protein